VTDELVDDGPGFESPEHNDPPRTVLDRVKARHRELQGEQSKEFDIPGYDGDLVGRYTVVDPDEAKARSKQINKLPEGERQLAAAMDQIALACVAILVREDGKLKPLDPDDPESIRYDDRLAAFFGFEAKSARGVIRQLFSTNHKLNVPAVVAHATEIGEWMADVSPEVDSNLLGE
jgi:hypothetical protein